MSTNTAKIHEAIDLARRLYAAAGFPDKAGTCVYHAAAMLVAGYELGLHITLQAGSAHFRRVPLGEDDGVEATHFAYEWEVLREQMHIVLAYLADGKLPEMHVWCGILDGGDGELVDLSTAGIPEQCQDLLGIPWKCPTPPPFVWTPVYAAPQGWSYEPDGTATQLAAALIGEMCLPDLARVARRIVGPPKPEALAMAAMRRAARR